MADGSNYAKNNFYLLELRTINNIVNKWKTGVFQRYPLSVLSQFQDFNLTMRRFMDVISNYSNFQHRTYQEKEMNKTRVRNERDNELWYELNVDKTLIPEILWCKLLYRKKNSFVWERNSRKKIRALVTED